MRRLSACRKGGMVWVLYDSLVWMIGCSDTSFCLWVPVLSEKLKSDAGKVIKDAVSDYVGGFIKTVDMQAPWNTIGAAIQACLA